MRFAVYATDIEYTLTGCANALMNILREFFVFLVLMIFVVVQNMSLAFCVLCVLLSMGLLFKKTLLKKNYIWGRHIMTIGTELSQRSFEFFHGFKEIFLLNKADFFIGRCDSLMRQKSKFEVYKGATQDLPRLLIETLFVSLVVFAVWFLYWTQGGLDHIFEVLGAYLYVGFRF